MHRMLHLRNIMYEKYIKFLDWLSGGMIFDLDYQTKSYKEAINLQNQRIAGLHDRLDANRRTIDEMAEIIKRYKEKDARIKYQKRQSYLRKKGK